MTSQIAVLGSANMDLVVTLARRPEPGETVSGTHFAMGPGGKGLNQAAAAARAGGRVRMLAAVGDDDFGAELVRRMAAEGIDTGGVTRRSTATGTAHIAVTDDGENSIVVVPGANAANELSDVDRASIAGSAYLVVQLERPSALLREAMGFARANGVATVLTPAPVDGHAASLVELADILVPNEGEAKELAGTDDAESAAIALSRTAGTVIVTLGARGAIVAQQGRITGHVPARPVTPVDTTAAGDTFVGVLVAALADGVELLDALSTATAAAAITVTRSGAVDAMPSLAEIRAITAGRR
ncbi:ribokinase [Agromyces sp. GXQ0307]|uniref:ribokinase n=1 Tax=Agromyces sp. GXQ0307 TaxID=3377835 RepID=UPI00383B9C9D